MREVCYRCRRARSACFCSRLRAVQTRTRVVFLQHPRERRVPISTARLAHLSLPNSELHTGIDFAGHARLEEILAGRNVAVLFPGEAAVDISTARVPDTLLVVDGTWSQARKLIKLNRMLSALPRIGFVPSRPSQYRIRREPAEHCVSTVEAVVEALSLLEEGGRARFEPMLEAFTWLVDHQLARARENRGPRRRRKKPGVSQDAALLGFARQTRHRQVLVYAESNSHPKRPAMTYGPEVVHWAAVRLGTGERFEAFLRPRKPLYPRTPEYLEVPAEKLLSAESVGDAVARWRAFGREGDVFAGWGQFTRRLLALEGERFDAWLDYRVVLTKAKKAIRALDIEEVAHLLAPGRALRQTGGRAQRRLSALECLSEAL